MPYTSCNIHTHTYKTTSQTLLLKALAGLAHQACVINRLSVLWDGRSAGVGCWRIASALMSVHGVVRHNATTWCYWYRTQCCATPLHRAHCDVSHLWWHSFPQCYLHGSDVCSMRSSTVQEAHFRQLKNSKRGFATVTAEQPILSRKLVQTSSFIF
jgi:hypothetical protein